MDIEIFRNPFIIKINNCFGDKVERSIFNEALKNEEKFTSATVVDNGNGIVDEDIRKNKSCYYDEIYRSDRSKSQLLESIQGLFSDGRFRSMMLSSPVPFNEFNKTNHHETQVSRYGDNEDFYTWHVDSLDNSQRKITFVYYFGDNEFSGGELQFSNSPLVNGELIEKKHNTYTFKPVKDTGFIFSANLAHTVLPTKSPTEFKKGRFSVNCWVGEV